MNENLQHRYLLLTGATGFLGTQVARRLLGERQLTLIALVRAGSAAAARQRLSRAWWDWPELAAALPSATEGADATGKETRIIVLAGDVSLPQLGLDSATYSRIAECLTHVIHVAADLRVDGPLTELRQTNVTGVANVIELARLAHRHHGLQRYTHVSTAYVAGSRSGIIAEADLSAEHGFSCTYELSKYEGECLAQAARSEVPVSVFRPAMIVGDSETGEIRTFNTFYFPLRLYLLGKLPIIPANPHLPVNIIPVDYVAGAIVRLTFCLEAEGLTFHLTAPAESLPRAGELLDVVRLWAREQLGLRVRRSVFVRLPLPMKRYRTTDDMRDAGDVEPQARPKVRRSELGGLLAYLPYFNEQKQFLRENVDRLLGPYTLNWRDYVPHLLQYAADQGFMHRSERTVHEQLLARLESKSRPVNYFDIVDGEVLPYSAADVREEILAAAAALGALGVQPGERVAIVGLNSTRYLVLDAAIGLTGAVSVPLYYTSPPAEVDHILTSSGARLLLAGAPKVLERLDEVRTELPVISFGRGTVPRGSRRDVIAWDAFLALGEGHSHVPEAPVGFDDLATLRYTSGTTGPPKGVSFQHAQLRWMAQTMAALLPWKARNKPVVHLSFLPMNHVVEGILATYAPYYLPTAVNIYFLEDLKAIQSALPRVRPTVFFSVPRIYEKIWEAVESNAVGRRYLALPGGLRKRALRTLLRWQTLRKAGLSRCAQLMTGSAPCSEELLQKFQALGIEIHNAYGLSEAPLVTLNRLGSNRLGTVGEPLPQTEIRLAEDGEVLVRGPQVMAGYFGTETDVATARPFQDGWLRTGDLGRFSSEGRLILEGRKKELFKTSYGKFVQPAKVEALLRQIPGVAEAMLIGEQRPFCAALLWINDNELDANTSQCLDRLVADVNQGLSHPEQIKRWAVLSNDLSIEAGDLTGNLKLKRQAVARRLDHVLEALYGGTSPSEPVLHIGEAERVTDERPLEPAPA